LGLGVDRDLPLALSLAAAHGQLPFAGGDQQVADVECDELGDPQPGEQQHAGDGPVPDPAGTGGGAFGGAQQPAGLVGVQRPGAAWGSCSRRVLAAGVGGAEPDEAVEVVDGGQGEVDRGGLGPADREQVGAVVPDGVVAGVPIGEWVALAAAGERVEFG